MDYLIKKSYLGIALDQTIEELGLQRITRQLSRCMRSSFMENFPELCQSAKQKVINIAGDEQKNKEAPIGLKEEKHSCLVMLGKGINYQDGLQFLNTKGDLTYFETFSKHTVEMEQKRKNKKKDKNGKGRRRVTSGKDRKIKKKGL